LNAGVKGEFSIYRYEEDNLPTGDQLIFPNETLAATAGKLKINLKPNSVVLCQQQ